MTPAHRMLFLRLSLLLSLPYLSRGMENSTGLPVSLITLPNDVLHTIVAQANRNSLRLVCITLHTITSTHNLRVLVTHKSFQGSLEDIIKACEPCIEMRDNATLKTITEKYGADFWFKPNIIGHSLYEYATRAGISIHIPIKNDEDMFLDDDTAMPMDHGIPLNGLYTCLSDQIYINRLYPEHTPTVVHNLKQELCTNPSQSNNSKIITTAAYNRDSKLLSTIMPLIPPITRYPLMDPLSIASMRGSPKCVDILLAHGMNPFDTKYFNQSALELAAYRRFTQCVRSMLKTHKYAMPTALYQRIYAYATQTEYKDLLELLHSYQTPTTTITL